MDCFIVMDFDLSIFEYFTITIVRLLSFLACSKNCKKQLLALPCLSTCPHGTTQLPLDIFSWNLIFESLLTNCQKKYKFH